MLFNSYEFVFIFLPITVIMFFCLAKIKSNLATLWLVIASVCFYGYWSIKYIPLLCGSILFNYFVGKHIEIGRNRKNWLILGIILDVALLGYYKYTDFFLTTINDLLGKSYFDLPHIVLPLGISFFTFTQIAYLVDAYRGETKNKSFLTYCEFVTIFPHLIAGPIIEHKSMIPQFVAAQTFKINWKNISIGISLFIMGLFKKVVVADSLSPWCEAVFSHVNQVDILQAWLGTLAYTLQLYFDFSGYSEMALGLGLMLNLKLPVNFDSPYQSHSIIDFWRRWHMTLGLWVKNYLYIPLGGNRHGELKKMRNLMVSMLIIGLWHGAGWTYIIWGGLHGCFLMINHQWRRLNMTLPSKMAWGLTFLCVVVSWVFFRSANMHDAITMLLTMANINSLALPDEAVYIKHFAQYGIPFIHWEIPQLFHQVLLVEGVLLIAVFKLKNPIVYIKNFHPNWRWFTIIFIMGVVALCKMNNYTEFLYFQF